MLTVVVMTVLWAGLATVQNEKQMSPELIVSLGWSLLVAMPTWGNRLHTGVAVGMASRPRPHLSCYRLSLGRLLSDQVSLTCHMTLNWYYRLKRLYQTPVGLRLITILVLLYHFRKTLSTCIPCYITPQMRSSVTQHPVLLPPVSRLRNSASKTWYII